LSVRLQASHLIIYITSRRSSYGEPIELAQALPSAAVVECFASGSGKLINHYEMGCLGRADRLTDCP